MDSKRILITGAAGFIGYHLAQRMLNEGWQVVGYDAITDYYDIKLKKARLEKLSQNNKFRNTVASLENFEALEHLAYQEKPSVIVHLAAQAGVRYSLENPRAYINSNIEGTFNVLEVARELGVKHLLMASTSSVYGANTQMPFKESINTDSPLTLYAATKKSNEVMAHSYAHLWKLPVTMFRFFTVYGPWGRPDMALFKFATGILKGQEIDVYNSGQMYRDFTYVEDLVRAIALLLSEIPGGRNDSDQKRSLGCISSAPFRVVNIGNSSKVLLLDFIEAIEEYLGMSAKKNFLEMQLGDVPETWADATVLHQLTGYKPKTDYRDGIRLFLDWFLDYYQIRAPR